MTRRQKMFTVLATHFYNEFNENSKPDKEFKELIGIINKDSKKHFTDKNILDYLTEAYDHLSRITRSKEIQANAMCLSLGCIFLMSNDGVYKGSTDMTVSRLSLGLYDKLFKAQGNQEGFKNANRLISQLDERI